MLYGMLAETSMSYTLPLQIEELKIQFQRCRQILEYCPYLNQTPEQQKALLSQKQDDLKRMW